VVKRSRWPKELNDMGCGFVAVWAKCPWGELAQARAPRLGS
jgi:hypothetical protein